MYTAVVYVDTSNFLCTLNEQQTNKKRKAHWYNGIIKCKSNIVPPWSKLKSIADYVKSIIDKIL